MSRRGNIQNLIYITYASAQNIKFLWIMEFMVLAI